jgi:hypothetical protein
MQSYSFQIYCQEQQKITCFQYLMLVSLDCIELEFVTDGMDTPPG